MSERCIQRAALAAGLLAVAGCSTTPTTSRLFERVTLEQSGDAGVHTYRIPALAVANDGTLIATFDARNASASDLPGDIDLMIRRSRDLGRSWSPAQRIADYRGGEGAGDSSLLTDRTTGRVFLFYAYGPAGVGFFNARPGNARHAIDTLHPHYLWSDDHGRTWQGPRDLIADIKQPDWQGIFPTSGHGIQTASGRLIQPYVYRDGAGAMHAANAYSDDHGSTWQMGASIGTGLDEHKAVELADGRVMQNLRAFPTSEQARRVAISTDGGVTFGPARVEAQLPDPRNNADIIRVAPAAPASAPESHWLLFSNTAHPTERRDLTVRLSCDDGQTWSAGKVLHAGSAMYSAMARLPDGTFGILYENGNEGISYARFNLGALDQSCAR